MKIKSMFFSNLFYWVSLYESRPPCFIAYVSDHELTAEYIGSILYNCPSDTFVELVGNGCHFPCQILLIVSLRNSGILIVMQGLITYISCRYHIDHVSFHHIYLINFRCFYVLPFLWFYKVTL